MLGNADHKVTYPARRPRTARWLLPSPIDVAFLLLLVSATVIRGWQAINTDGDLGRHIRVGETILMRGSLFHEDLFSWTMAGAPFVPYEWLSEICFAVAHRIGGIPAVLAMTGAVIASSYLLLALLLRRRGVDPLFAFIVTIMAGLVSAFHWLARPHVFSFLGVVLLLSLLEGRKPQDAESGAGGPFRPPVLPSFRAALAAFLLFVLWANLHGGFLYGLVMLGMYLVGDLVSDRAALPRHGLMLIAALAGSCANPVGPALLEHVTGYLGNTFLVDMTLEYRSPDFHGWVGRTFLVALLCTIASLGLSARRLSWPHLVVFLGTTAFALHSVRNVPLWALTAFPLAAMHFDTDWKAVGGRGLARLRLAFDGAQREFGAGVWSTAGTLVIGALALAGGKIGSLQLLEPGFDPRIFPVAEVQRLREAGHRGRLFNELAWGGYILYAWPQQKVFIDGQTDFYGEELSRRYVAIRAAEGNWRDALRQAGVRLILLPPEAPLVRVLDGSGWRRVSSDQTSVLLERVDD